VSSAEDQWRKVLVTGHRPLVVSRRLWRYVPSAPRCKVCGNPFAGIGGRIARVAGFAPSRKNPNLCARCCDALPPGGAEVDVAVLFADVRGSTALGERASASDYASLLNRFYGVATEVLLRHDGLIDKLIGDEAMGLFLPGVAGPDYRRKAVKAGLEILRGVGYGSAGTPWLTVGVAVNAGLAYVGNVGTEVVDFTALGDPVNVAAALQESARSGELVVAADVHDDVAALLPRPDRRTLQVRGRQAPIPVLVADLQ
jgi:adenylate cyclase